MVVDVVLLMGLGVALLGGAAVGLERQWSGHADGPTARFAGIRTFSLLGLVAGIAGALWQAGGELPAAALVAGSAALVVTAYAAASRHDVEGTTEVAALVVLAAGVLAGAGQLRLASGIIAGTTLLLVEKSRLHAWVRRIDDVGLRAGVRFAVMAMVVLPLLPAGPFGPLGGVRPRELWALVLFFSGLSFAGFVARRAVGEAQGYPMAGLLGGLMSSTSVTLTFSRVSRESHRLAGPLATGVLAACTVAFLRVILAVTVLNPALVPPLLLFMMPPLLVGAAWSFVSLRRATGTAASEGGLPGNPLELKAALQMAALFQGMLYAVYAARQVWGRAGVVASAAVMGLTDVDALTISIARQAEPGLSPGIGALAIAVGVLANGLLKLGLAAFLGAPGYRGRAVRPLAALALVQAAAVAWALR